MLFWHDSWCSGKTRAGGRKAECRVLRTIPHPLTDFTAQKDSSASWRTSTQFPDAAVEFQVSSLYQWHRTHLHFSDCLFVREKGNLFHQVDSGPFSHSRSVFSQYLKFADGRCVNHGMSLPWYSNDHWLSCMFFSTCQEVLAECHSAGGINVFLVLYEMHEHVTYSRRHPLLERPFFLCWSMCLLTERNSGHGSPFHGALWRIFWLLTESRKPAFPQQGILIDQKEKNPDRAVW